MAYVLYHGQAKAMDLCRFVGQKIELSWSFKRSINRYLSLGVGFVTTDWIDDLILIIQLNCLTNRRVNATA